MEINSEKIPNAVFLHDWADSGASGIISDFGIKPSELDGCRIIVASYTYEDYSGEAFVLFERDGKLYEVNGSHCSCYGLSESDYCGSTTTQWQPEETSLEALSRRNFYGAEDIKKCIDAAKEAIGN